MSEDSHRTKLFAVAAAGAVAIVGAGMRRLRMQAAATRLRETVSVQGDPSMTTGPVPVADESHAPGHRHLGRPPRAVRYEREPSWPRRADRNGHPGRFSG